MDEAQQKRRPSPRKPQRCFFRTTNFELQCDNVLMNRSFLLAILMALLGAPAFAQNGVSLNDEARFLAGMSVHGSPIEDHTRSQAWMEHATAMDSAFNKQEQRQLARVRAWSKAMVPGSGGTGTMYYMFSGPDFLYANAFYPGASTYILCGTEPVGDVPDLSKLSEAQLDMGIMGLRQSMKTILDFHYFITKDMRVDLSRTQINGTLPILFVFMARTGNSVEAVEKVSSPAPGVKITFSGSGGHGQTLYYFRTDLSNGGKSSGFLKWCAGQGPGMSLLKAASYLMHSDEFSNVRNFLVQNSQVLVEDDSGIPWRDLQGHFDLHVYGTYQGPIQLFAKYYQPELENAFRTNSPGPLGFGFGYHWQTERGMLILATKR